MMKVKKQNHSQSIEIPIFFATDDNYIPFLDVAISSLIKNASTNYKYVINILNTGIKEENIKKVKSRENDNFTINFVNIENKIKEIKDKFRNVYHFSVACYYRLFIESLFHQYDKVIYLDCDIVVLGDISRLYNINLGNCLVGAVVDQIVPLQPIFCKYCDNCIGVNHRKYFSSGILLMNLEKFRECKIQDKFMYLISEYNFDVVDPDQAYLNFLCRDKVKYLPNGWNKQSLPTEAVGGLNIVHYA